MREIINDIELPFLSYLVEEINIRNLTKNVLTVGYKFSIIVSYKGELFNYRNIVHLEIYSNRYYDPNTFISIEEYVTLVFHYQSGMQLKKGYDLKDLKVYKLIKRL